MEMHQIRYFLSVAQTLNFTRAAEECHVSQPALTRAIQALEGELGGPLLRRERLNTHLTELGKRMLPLVQRCYDSAMAARELAHAVTSPDAAPFSVAFSHSVNLTIFMDPISELFRTHSGMQLKLLHGGGAEIAKLLKDGDADLAIAGPLDDSWDRLDNWALFTESFDLALHRDHALAMSNEIAPERLAGEKLLLQSGCESRAEAVRRLNISALAADSGNQVVTHHDLLALLDANLGIAIVPASAPQSANILRKSLVDTGLRRTVSVYGVAGRRRSAPCTTFLNLVRSADWSAYDSA